MTAVNLYLAENIPPNRFVTFFCAEIDPKTNLMTYINAGHNPPFVARSDGSILKLPAGSVPLGISPNVEFMDGQMQLSAGDMLVVYSDGVSETNNRRGEEFGEVRLHEVVLRNRQASAAGMRDRIESALTQFAQGTPAADDITLVIVKVLNAPA
ncbi:MAG: PP2C family protein-serine/threonine phosphatase [Pyrinomonadaceae bacterium]